MPTFDGIISADQLRSEIGSPTADPREQGAVTDEELQNIIDRNEEILDQMILQRLEQRALEGGPVSDKKTYEEVQVSLTDDGTHAEGDIPDTYYPMTYFEGEAEGAFFEYDPNLQAESTGFFDRNRFIFVGQRVMVIPSTTSAITLQIPTKAKVRERMGDMVSKANQKIIAQAREMLAAKVTQGERMQRSDLDQ